jgi:hypothetical protein
MTLQYYQPQSPLFVGDCMPFFHEGVFHLYYLVDEGHHSGLGGLGGHQWAHASTEDLVHWVHHELALTITRDWEGSICTGSVFWNAGVYYAFFAVRTTERKERLAYAISFDGITFEKQEPYPLLAAPAGYEPGAFRDPFVFRDTIGQFNMLITAKATDFPIHGRGSCILRLTSSDLTEWKCEEPFLFPSTSGDTPFTPECSEYFEWNDWFYLIFGSGGGPTRYRMSKCPTGPWHRPAVDILDGPMTSVMKTAPFTAGRRIGAAWIGSRYADGAWKFGGAAVFRELVQNVDGTLGVTMPPEMAPKPGDPIAAQFHALLGNVQNSADGNSIIADGITKQAACVLSKMPGNYRLKCHIEPDGEGVCFGFGVHGQQDMADACIITFDPGLKHVSVGDLSIDGVNGMDQPLNIELFVTDTIVDLCINNSRCLINRWPFSETNRFFIWCANGKAAFRNIEIAPLQ